VKQSVFRKFLFNNDRINIGFVFICVFGVFILFSAIMVGYGGFIYSSYLKLYKTRTIHDLAYGVEKILEDKNIKESRKPYEISLLFSYFQKDPSISELWVTDKELRLTYSSRADIQRSFSDKKLPNEYFPLYRNIFNPGVDGHSPVVTKDFGRWETGLVMAVRTSPKSQYDFTVGIRLHKYNFFLEPVNIKLKNGMQVNITPSLIFIFFILVSIIVSSLLTFFLSSFFNVFEQNSRLFASHVQKILDTGDFTPGNVKLPEDNTAIFGPLSRSLNMILSQTLAFKDTESAERVKKSITDDKTFTHRTLYDTLFPKVPIEIKGCENAVYVSGFNVQSHHVLLAKDKGSFETDFLLVTLAERDFEQYLLTYNAIRDVFMTWKGRESLVELNALLRLRHLPYVTAVTGRFNAVDSTMEILHCGFGSFIIYNSKLDDYVLPSQESLAIGKKSDDDLLLLMKEQKIRFDSGDRILFFNNDLLAQDVTMETLKKEMAGDPAVSAEDTLNRILSATSATTKNAFCFLIKKR